MASLSRPPQRRKRSTSSNTSSSSFSFKNPYDDVLLSGGVGAKFEPREYAEIFSGSSSIPVLDLSGLNEPAGCRSSDLDYSNIFGASGDDVAVSFDQLFNKKTKTRIQTDAESPFQEHSSSTSSGKAKRSLGSNVASADGLQQQLNMSFNKTVPRSSNETNGKMHIAELHAVPGFTHFVDETTQVQKKEDDDRPAHSMKRDASRTWSFKSDFGAATVKGGVSFENLSSFSSKETIGKNLPPLSDEELDENSDAAVSIAALRKAIEQAQESIRLTKMIMQKKSKDTKNGSGVRRSKGRSKVEDKMENGTEYASRGLKENDVTEKNQQLDPTGIDGKSSPVLSHSDKLLNAQKATVSEAVRENFEAANDHGNDFVKVDKKFAPSKKVEVENIRQIVGASEPLGEMTNITRSVETVFGKSVMVDCNDNSISSGTLGQRESTVHQQGKAAVFSGEAESVVNIFQSVQVLELEPNDKAVEQCQETADLAKQLERVASVSGSKKEQERITHEGGDMRIIPESEESEDSDGIADNEKCEKKFVGNERSVEESDFNTLQNESLNLAEKNMLDQADIAKPPENVFARKEDGQDGKCSDEDENGMVPKEEILWSQSELQVEEHVEEEIREMEPGFFPGVGEAVTKVDMILEPESDDKNDSESYETVPGELEENEVELKCMNEAECEQVESTRKGMNGGSPLCVEESNDSSSEKDASEAFAAHSNDAATIFSETPQPCNVEFDKVEEYQEVLRGCEENNVLPRETETFSAFEDNEVKHINVELNRMPERDSLHGCASVEKFAESQLNSSFEGLSLVCKSPSVVLSNEDHEKPLPNDEDMLKTDCEIHNTGEECAANTNMQNGLHESTSKQEESFDSVNVKPDRQQCPENSKESQSPSTLESIDEVSVDDTPTCRDDANDISSDKEEVRGDVDMDSDEKVVHSVQPSECLKTEPSCNRREMDTTVDAEREIKPDQRMEKNMQNLRRTSTSEQQQEAKRNEQKFEIDDHLQRIEAIKRGREREKDRIAVDKVIREARERAFAEARERAERAAAEKAAAEARERVKAEVRVKTAKASVETKASFEAKLRAERAAVERATAEARERALEKARVQTVKHATEGASSSPTNNRSKHSSSSSDSVKFDGATSESAQRRKARLERHQRIMERAAKALAEKNMRDLLVQKEQAERNRIAESLDIDIKRWAAGKEGNLRALLSTLQYILGPDSGWKPLALTEIVTAAAVKKAYRKATLCVHPDKLQQRGASIQHKYICEKIFDLLKAAWNRFNSEEN